MLWPHAWPWIYGDAYGSFAADSPDNNLPLPAVQETLLRQWVEGDFVADWPPKVPPPAYDRPGPARRAPGDAGQGRAAFLPRRCVSSRLRDDLADAPRQHVREAVPHPPSTRRNARTGLRAGADPADRIAAGRSAVRARAGRYQPLDGIALAGRHRLLPLRLRHPVRSLCADVLAGARAEPGADRRRLSDGDRTPRCPARCGWPRSTTGLPGCAPFSTRRRPPRTS